MKLVKWQLSGYEADEVPACGYALNLWDAQEEALKFLREHNALEPGWRDQWGADGRHSWKTVFKFETYTMRLDRDEIIEELNFALCQALTPVRIIW